MTGYAPTGSFLIFSRFLRATAALLLALSIYLVVGVAAECRPSHRGLHARASLLAVGDTGKVHRPLASLLEGQLAVADGLAVEDRVHPVNAIVLLGDNFYMQGLLRSELVHRIDMNLAYPYCRFVELAGPRSAELPLRCSRAARRSPVLPIYAVLGNHDLPSAESPALQRDVIPEFISNWKLSSDLAVNREFDGGLSLILFDSESFVYDLENRAALVEALKAAKGPWRVLAAHRPISINEDGGVPKAGEPGFDYMQWVRRAIEESGVHVHLFLSGHHHSLQLLEGGGALGPDLHVVVGSGARYRKILAGHPKRRYQAERLGFVRVDVVDISDLVTEAEPEANDEGAAQDNPSERLVVSLFRSPTIPLLSLGGPELVARWWVGPEGDLVQADVAP